MSTQATSSPRHLVAVAAAAALGLTGCLDAAAEGDAAPEDDVVPEGAESIETSALQGAATYIHRGFKPATGEHFYTTSFSEIFFGEYQLEGYNYFGLDSQDAGVDWVPFYRCYWSSVDKHLYTTQANCEGVAWNEGQLGFISNANLVGTTPLYRLFQPSNADHLYTTSLDEAWFAWSVGYHYEGVAGYVLPKP